MRSLVLILAVIATLSACNSVLESEPLIEMADAANNQKMDRICQEIDALVDRVVARFDDMSNSQVANLGRLSREQRSTCNDRSGVAFEWFSSAERIKAELKDLLEASE